ncbi:hypothetical protein AVEN_240719-1 [Araneus ventricosus]|uniref:Uncharacterized protein n=1 Tax=Araneus ventricosus TaxID=182803 RepID=A0A4Y2JTD2_ARAVE|nr:hypothetical protein AVEN_240719-1 [Araneus ventricosus]
MFASNLQNSQACPEEGVKYIFRVPSSDTPNLLLLIETLNFPTIGSSGKNNPAVPSNMMSCPTKNFQAKSRRVLVEMSSSRFPAVIFNYR